MNKINVYEIVRRHFPDNEFALMQEVRDAAGHHAKRSADYIAMNLWPSRGLAVHGIEQKAFRSDWLSELKKPEKADSIFRYCDYWWLLTTGDNIAKIEEIPESWGWMQIRNGKIKIIKHAPKLTPVDMSRGFIACLLKRASSKEGFIRVDSIQDKIEQAKLTAESARNYKYDSLKQNYDVLEKQFKEFREHTGINIGNINEWRQPNMAKIGAAVNLMAKGEPHSLAKDLERLQESALRISESIRINLESLSLATKKDLA